MREVDLEGDEMYSLYFWRKQPAPLVPLIIFWKQIPICVAIRLVWKIWIFNQNN